MSILSFVNILREEEVLLSNLNKLLKEPENINAEKALKEIQKNQAENELRIKQEKYNETKEENENADENENTTTLKSQLSTLQNIINTLTTNLNLIKFDLENLTNKHAQKSSAIRIQRKNIDALNKGDSK